MKTLMGISFAAALWTAVGGAVADDAPYKGRLFDSHVHYSHQAWDVFDAKTALRMMDEAGVRGALMSSTPDEGTQRLLAERHPRVAIRPMFRPYTPTAGSGSWFKRPERIASAEAAVAAGRHRGIGEVHVPTPKVLDSPAMRRLLGSIAASGGFIQPHGDAAAVEKLFEIAPGLKVVWAHAGFSDPPEVIERMMDTYPNLWADLSYREGEIMSADGIEPEWRALFVKHAERFMIGSDTWAVDRWYAFPGTIADNRAWLGHLPGEVADKIAHLNGERLFAERRGD